MTKKRGQSSPDKLKQMQHLANSPKTKEKHSKSKDQGQCVTCKNPVTDTQHSMQCDICDYFTHVSCDDSINRNLYDALNSCEDNPLFYLCTSCSPIINLLRNTSSGGSSDYTAQLKALATKICDLENNLSTTLTKHTSTLSDISSSISELTAAHPGPTKAMSDKIDNLNLISESAVQKLDILQQELLANNSKPTDPSPQLQETQDLNTKLETMCEYLVKSQGIDHKAGQPPNMW